MLLVSPKYIFRLTFRVRSQVSEVKEVSSGDSDTQEHDEEYRVSNASSGSSSQPGWSPVAIDSIV